MEVLLIKFLQGFYAMKMLRETLLLLACILSLSSSNAFAFPGIRGPVQKVGIPEIEIVLLKRQTIGVFQHHFMCVYVWNGVEWITGTAGLIQNEDSEVSLCQSNLEANIANPDFVLKGTEYLELENQYFQILASRGIGNFVNNLGGMFVTPFTLGYSKPCYLEVELLASLAQSVLESGENSPSVSKF